MHLRATEVKVTYRVVEPFRLPFHSGSMLRGVLGRALRAAGCGNVDAVCSGECERPRACTYARLFDPLVPEPLPHRFLKGQTKAPQPMIPMFPAPGQGNPSFSLRILGRLQRGELATLLEALELVSKFELGDEKGRLIFERATLEGSPEAPIAVEPSENVERIEIEFVTPAWLEHEGRLMDKIDFQPFFQAVYRRLTILCALYGEGAEQADVDFPRLDALAKQIKVTTHDVRPEDWERHSRARDRRHPMQGIRGRVVFEGKELGAFAPMLRLAEKTHIGKATSFGLGRTRVTTG